MESRFCSIWCGKWVRLWKAILWKWISSSSVLHVPKKINISGTCIDAEEWYWESKKNQFGKSSRRAEEEQSKSSILLRVGKLSSVFVNTNHWMLASLIQWHHCFEFVIFSFLAFSRNLNVLWNEQINFPPLRLAFQSVKRNVLTLFLIFDTIPASPLWDWIFDR